MHNVIDLAGYAERLEAALRCWQVREARGADQGAAW
jgi:hypothetical protein